MGGCEKKETIINSFMKFGIGNSIDSTEGDGIFKRIDNNSSGESTTNGDIIETGDCIESQVELEFC